MTYEFSDDGFLADHGVTKASMQLIDEDRAHTLYDAMGPGVEISGGSGANTTAGVAGFVASLQAGANDEETPDDGRESLPELIAERPERWLERHAPERRAKVISAEGEFQAAEKLADAAIATR